MHELTYRSGRNRDIHDCRSFNSAEGERQLLILWTVLCKMPWPTFRRFVRDASLSDHLCVFRLEILPRKREMRRAHTHTCSNLIVYFGCRRLHMVFALVRCREFVSVNFPIHKIGGTGGPVVTDAHLPATCLTYLLRSRYSTY